MVLNVVSIRQNVIRLFAEVIISFSTESRC